MSNVAQDRDGEDVADRSFTTSVSYHIRQQKNNLPQWWKHNQSEIIIMNDLKQSKTGYYEVTHFSLRSPQLKPLTDMTGQYYRWFYVDVSTKISSEDMDNGIHPELHQKMCIDSLQLNVKLLKTEIKEVVE